MISKFVALVAAALLTGLLAASAHAQPWPQRSVKLILPLQAGSATDVTRVCLPSG
jgi:tripartite-type tricarboxylate transporter receptor subunit TctC